MELFQELNIGFQITIIAALLAGLLFLIIIFYGFSRKGIKFLLKIIYKERLIHERFKNRLLAKILTIGLLICVFLVIIGLIVAFSFELIGGFSFSSLREFSDGQRWLLGGLISLLVIGLIFAFNFLWHNGYYLIAKLIFNLEEEEA